MPAGAATDRDRDGLSDTAERRHRTDPRKPDTDRDGLKDGREVKQTRTNPRRADTDRDGVSDGREVLLYKSNPRKRDTDGDTWSDGTEVKRRTGLKNRFDPCPFTGLKATRGSGRYAAAVVVADMGTARPHAGLERTDVVIEHPIEGGATRFAAVFGCERPTAVGPVRSARFDTKQIVEPYTNAIAYGGANSVVQAHLDTTGVLDLTEQTAPDAFTRSSDTAPDNLFVDVTKLPQAPIAGRPHTFGKVQSTTTAQQVALNFGGTDDVTWQFSGGRWIRSENGAPVLDGAGQIAADNVLVQVIDVMHSTSLFDAAGNPSPDMKWGRGGVAHLFRNGRVVTGVWTVARGKLHFRTSSGLTMRLAIGRTWIEMVPSQAGDVKGTVSFS